MTSPSKQCIFCDSTGKMSSEHVLPEWVDKLFPGREPIHYYNRRLGEQVVAQDIAINKANTQRVLNRVCQVCNNTWMSALQEDAKPLLTPLIFGKWEKLDQRIAEVIASWATMTSIVAITSAGHSVPVEDRSQFHRDRRPPPEWQLWIGMRSTSHNLHMVA